MQKTIHYVWVGNKPLPRLAKKCIKSWKKYLPDWEIIEWNEKNFDLENSPPFVQQAYKLKKWAFVADYIRTKVLYEHGGIYFDTDMEVLKNLDKFLEKPAFLGREYEGDEKEMVSAGVMYFANKHDPFLREMLDFYESIERFNIGLMYSYAIPKVITRILDKYQIKKNSDGTEVYNGYIWVYPKDYFYPVNYDWSKEFYSENTVMIHHYDASWTGSSNKRNVAIRKALPWPVSSVVLRSLDAGSKAKSGVKHRVHTANRRARRKASIYLKTSSRLAKLARSVETIKTGDYLVFSNPNWVGVSHAAEDMFGGYAPIEEVVEYRQQEIDQMADVILSAKKRLLIFNSLVPGWERVIESLRDKDETIKIKVLCHGGDVRLARHVDYQAFMKILGMHNMGLINEIGFVKKQQAEFYRRKGFRVRFVANNVILDNLEKYRLDNKSKNKGENSVKIGLYCSGDIEWKNVFNQVAAASLVEDAIVDIVPINHMIAGYADKLHVRIIGEDKLLPRDELLSRMAGNDVNLYVSFAEASPLLPLESMELGVPCVTANNHHYWTGTALEKYLVVNRPDDMLAIYDQLRTALKHRAEVIRHYKAWKKSYNKEAANTIQEFLNS